MLIMLPITGKRIKTHYLRTLHRQSWVSLITRVLIQYIIYETICTENRYRQVIMDIDLWLIMYEQVAGSLIV